MIHESVYSIDQRSVLLLCVWFWVDSLMTLSWQNDCYWLESNRESAAIEFFLPILVPGIVIVVMAEVGRLFNMIFLIEIAHVVLQCRKNLERPEYWPDSSPNSTEPTTAMSLGKETRPHLPPLDPSLDMSGRRHKVSVLFVCLYALKTVNTISSRFQVPEGVERLLPQHGSISYPCEIPVVIGYLMRISEISW